MIIHTNNNKSVLQIHRAPLFDRCVEAMKKKGGTALMSAKKIDAFIEALGSSASKDTRIKFRTTVNGEYRIRNCKKIDLIGAYRIVCIEKDNHLVLLYAGSHEDCFRWIERNKGLTYNVSSDSDAISVERAVGQGMVETLPEDVLEERRFVQEFEQALKSRLDDETLYSIFPGWGRRCSP